MSESIAGARKNDILETLKTTLAAVDGFKDRVFKGFRTKVQYPQAILLHLYEDALLKETTGETIHSITINCVVRLTANIGADPEVEMESFIETVGKVEDALEAVHANQPHWESIKVSRSVYTFKANQTFVSYSCFMQLVAEAEW